MNGLFVGINSRGTTSQLRARTLQQLMPHLKWQVIDTDESFLNCFRWARTLAYRTRLGPAVRAVNQSVMKALSGNDFRAAWVDKGVCLYPETIAEIRRRSEKMVHYTPDTAFLKNHSRYFNATAGLYDLVVTTKSFELNSYRKLVPAEQLMLVTQSFDESLHYPRCSFAAKRPEATLIGLCEADRESCVRHLLNAGVSVAVGGRNWDRFLSKAGRTAGLRYLGPTVFGDEYAVALSGSQIGLGLLTRRFPELHTTRTFEIPACGTLLATPAASETRSLFSEEEAVFFEDYGELAGKLAQLMKTPELVERMATAGYRRVQEGGFTNRSVLTQILQRLEMIAGFSSRGVPEHR